MIFRAVRSVAAEAVCGLGYSVVECCRQPCAYDMAGRTLAQIMIFRFIVRVAGTAVFDKWSFMVESHITPGCRYMAYSAV